MKKLFMFVDGDNLYHSQHKLGWWLDFEKLKEFVAKYGEVVGLHYYTGVTNMETVSRASFRKHLARVGFSVTTEPTRWICKNGDGHDVYEANLDPYIARDAALYLNQYDVGILVSGDYDFKCIIDMWKNSGKEFYLIATSSNISTDLRSSVGMSFIELDDLKEELEKDYEREENQREDRKIEGPS